MPVSCSVCGRVTSVRFVQTGQSTFDRPGPPGWKIDGKPFEKTASQDGIYLCRDCFGERYPMASWDAPAAETEPAGPEWLPDDVREGLGDRHMDGGEYCPWCPFSADAYADVRDHIQEEHR